MTDSIHRFTENEAIAARRAVAGAALCVAVLFVLGALWTMSAYKLSWSMLAIDLMMVACAVGTFVYACETYASVRPGSQRSEERLRYMQSQSLYVPGSMREARRRRTERH